MPYSIRKVLRSVPCDAAEYSRLQSEAEKARRSQQHLYEKANSPGNAPRAVLAQEFTTKTTISSGPMDKVRSPAGSAFEQLLPVHAIRAQQVPASH